jgi:hypothetical protein
VPRGSPHITSDGYILDCVAERQRADQSLGDKLFVLSCRFAVFPLQRWKYDLVLAQELPEAFSSER